MDSSQDDKRIQVTREYFRLADQGRREVLELFHDEAEIYFPKFGFGFGRQSLFAMVRGFDGVLEFIQHDYGKLTFIPAGDYVVVEGRSRGRLSGKTWAGGQTPGSRFCNVFKLRGDRISSLHVYLDPDYTGEDIPRFRWGVDRKWWGLWISSTPRSTIIQNGAVMVMLVATDREVVVIDVERGAAATAHGIDGRPTCLTADPLVHGRAWCGTHRNGLFRTDDGGTSWQSVGLAGRLIMAVTASPADRDMVWVGTEPSEVWRSGDAGNTWEQTSTLETLSSSSEWSFPPRPDTHHVRWIACHPLESERLWVAIEAGALVSTVDGGRTWSDRVPGGPRDTHELAIHRGAPDILRVSAGDGYFESDDAGATWRSPNVGLEVGYLRSVAIDPEQPEVVVVSASSGPHSAYVAGRSDGRLYRRLTRERWERVLDGWPESASTIAPLLCAGVKVGELWAADERGVHRSDDGGKSWRRAVGYATSPQHLRGLALVR